MKIKIANVECSLMTFGTLVDCYPRVCFLCKHLGHGEFEEKEVTPKELRDLIRTNNYIIKV
jgi:hypothetical protein